jgi:septum formation protein
MLLLASGSATRARLLQAARIPFEARPPRLDEAGLRAGLEAEGISPRDIADALAEAKARKVGARLPEALVLGTDQVAEIDGRVLAKPADAVDAQRQIRALAGKRHALHSAAVLFEEGRPTWRVVSTARLTMRPLSEAYVAAYVTRNWESIRHSVGGYLIEEEGVRLFRQVEGDPFTVQGLPLLPLIDHLVTRGLIES